MTRAQAQKALIADLRAHLTLANKHCEDQSLRDEAGAMLARLEANAPLASKDNQQAEQADAQ